MSRLQLQRGTHHLSPKRTNVQPHFYLWVLKHNHPLESKIFSNTVNKVGVCSLELELFDRLTVHKQKKKMCTQAKVNCLK